MRRGRERERGEGMKYNGEYPETKKGIKDEEGERDGNGDKCDQNTLYTCV